MKVSNPFILLLLMVNLFSRVYADTKLELNPKLEDIPYNRFVPVVYDTKNEKLYWALTPINIRNGVHSLIVKQLTGLNNEELSNGRARELGYLAGGFIVTSDEVINFHCRNSFNSFTYNQGTYTDVQQKLLAAIRKEFPNSYFRHKPEIFDQVVDWTNLTKLLTPSMEHLIEVYNIPLTKRGTNKIVQAVIEYCSGLFRRLNTTADARTGD